MAATGTPGRRSSWPILLLTVGFVVGGPGGSTLFLAGPVLLLLAVSHPRGREEWFGMLVAIISIGMVVRGAPSLAEQTARAAAACFAGALVVATLAGLRSLSNRLLTATGVAALATVAWLAHLGVRFATLRDSLVTELWIGYRGMFPELPPVPIDRAALAALSSTARDGMAARLSANVHMMGELYPAILALTALAGGWLAWTWYHRLATRPLGAPPRPVSALRFNDQLVWLLILALGLTLFTVPEPVALVASNLLFVLGALYWARGLAITRYVMALLPAPPLFKIAVTALLVLPLAFGGWLLIGVADTWLDIRRRLPPQGAST